jgi:hypothetical protein
MEDRVSTIDGNYITDALGGPYDLIFVSVILNFHKHNLDDLFQKVYDSLNSNGIFITHQDGITAERTRLVYHISEFLSAELMGMDFAFRQGEIAEAMLRCGLCPCAVSLKIQRLGILILAKKQEDHFERSI